MELTLQTFLRLLRNLALFFRKRWIHLARRLWYIFSNLRLRISSQHPKKTGDIRRNSSRSAKPSMTTVICASRLPPPLTVTPIAGGDSESPVIASPSPVSIQIRGPTILNPADILEESNGNNTDHLDAEGWGRGPISGSPDFSGYHKEPDHIRIDLPSHREGSTSSSPVTPSRPNSTHSSRYSYRPTSQYSGFRPGDLPWSQYSHHPPSEHSYRSPPSLNGAESAARGYLAERPSPRPSSPARSARPPSIAGSVSSRVYRVSRPITRVRRPSPMANAPLHGDRSPTPASFLQSVHETRSDVSGPEPPQPESRATALRPMIGIDRYEKHKMVTVEIIDKNNVCSPVTTQFPR